MSESCYRTDVRHEEVREETDKKAQRGSDGIEREAIVRTYRLPVYSKLTFEIQKKVVTIL